MHVKFKPGTTLDGKTPNECAKEGLYLTNPNALSPRWFAISSYIKTFNFVIFINFFKENENAHRSLSRYV